MQLTQRNATLSAAGILRFAYYACLSQPASERALYRAVRRHRPRRIVELGMGTSLRAQRLIRVARRYCGGDEVRYTGIDAFELREAGRPELGLKQAYHTLRRLGAKVQLAPGDPFTALARIANALTGTDLLIIGAENDAESLARAWFYVPRMLHAGSCVFIEEPRGGAAALRRLRSTEIDQLAGGGDVRTRRAA